MKQAIVPLVILLLSLFIMPPEVHAATCDATVLQLISPTPHQIFQRYNNKGTMYVSGNLNTEGGTFMANFNGATTQLVVTSRTTSAFSGIVPQQQQGQGVFTLTWTDGPCTKTAIARYVGVGDIFLVAGQSNNVGAGLNLQSYSHPTLKAAAYTAYPTYKQKYPEPWSWHDLNDGANGGQRSYLPLLATKIMSAQNVPVAFILAAVGNTKIVAVPGDPYYNWNRDDARPFNPITVYGRAVSSARSVHGIRAILWWQGEGNFWDPRDQYKNELIALTDNFKKDLGPGIPLVAYQIGQVWADINPDQNRTANIVHAIQDAAAERPNDIILGPSLNDVDLTPTYKPGTEHIPANYSITAGVHFVTDAQLTTVANRVYPVLANSIYKVPTSSLWGDLNGDGKVDIFDYNLLVGNFGKSGSRIAGDVNKSGKVDIFDYNILVGNFGK